MDVYYSMQHMVLVEDLKNLPSGSPSQLGSCTIQEALEVNNRQTTRELVGFLTFAIVHHHHPSPGWPWVSLTRMQSCKARCLTSSTIATASDDHSIACSRNRWKYIQKNSRRSYVTTWYVLTPSQPPQQKLLARGWEVLPTAFTALTSVHRDTTFWLLWTATIGGNMIWTTSKVTSANYLTAFARY